jgi:anti-sigma B factor antagonist
MDGMSSAAEHRVAVPASAPGAWSTGEHGARCTTYDELAVEVEGRGAAVRVVRVSGELDILTGRYLETLLVRELEQRPRVLVVDLARVVALGSTGLAVLCRMHDSCRRQGTELAVSGSRRADLARQLRLTGLERLSIGGDTGGS